MLEYFVKKLTDEQIEKLKSGLELLCEDTTTLDKFQKVVKLIKGLSPKADEHLEKAVKIVEKIKLIQEGDVITLSLDKYQGKTKKQKKIKKLLLLFFGHWKSLRGEIARISALHTAVTIAGTGAQLNKGNSVKIAKILATAKGPVGAVTIAAAGIVAVSVFVNSRAVDVTVRNIGCQPIRPVSAKVINIPGLKLPATAITNGSQGFVKIPGLNLTINTTQTGKVSLGAVNLSKSFDMPYEIRDVIYDGQSLMGKETQVNLSSAKTHELIVKCTP
jgi:hypothetical protein